MVFAMSMREARKAGPRRILKSPLAFSVTATLAPWVMVATAPAVLVTVFVVLVIKLGSDPFHCDLLDILMIDLLLCLQMLKSRLQ